MFKKTSKNTAQALRVQDISKLLEVPVSKLPQECIDIINKGHFKFRYPGSEERDSIILMIIKILESDKLFHAGKTSKKIWKKIWSDHLKRFKAKKFDLNELMPDFFRSGDLMRLNGDFIIANDPKFKFDFYDIQRRLLFQKYFKDLDAIYEFGCGTGHNLVALAKMFPKKAVYGLDWIPEIKELIGIIAKQYKFNMYGEVFDMEMPRFNLSVKENSAFLTTWSLEQLGKRFEPYLKFVLAKKPKVVIDINSFVELYDSSKLTEYLTIRFNNQRSYLQGYLARLRELEKEGKIIIHKIHNVQLGTLFHNGFAYVIWSPVSRKK